jgi:hypothetical protein
VDELTRAAHLGQLRVAVAGGVHERSAGLLAHPIRVGSDRQQQPDHLRLISDGQKIMPLLSSISAAKITDPERAVPDAGVRERRTRVSVHRVHMGASIKEILSTMTVRL